MPSPENVPISGSAYQRLSEYRWEEAGESIEQQQGPPVKYLMRAFSQRQIHEQMMDELDIQDDQKGLVVLSERIYETRTDLMKALGVIEVNQLRLAELASAVEASRQSRPGQIEARLEQAGGAVQRHFFALDNANALIDRYAEVARAQPEAIQEFIENPGSLVHEARLVLLMNYKDFLQIDANLTYGKQIVNNGPGEHAKRYSDLLQVFSAPRQAEYDQSVKNMAKKMLDNGGFVDVLNSNLKLPPDARQVLETQTMTLAVLSAELLGKSNPVQYAAEKLVQGNKMNAKLQDQLQRAGEIASSPEGQHLGLPESVRKQVDAIKFSFLSGGAVDKRIKPLIDVLADPDWRFSKEGSRDVRQLIENILADSQDPDTLEFSPQNLTKLAAEMNGEAASKKGVTVEGEVLEHMALYELAEAAKAKIIERAKADYGKQFTNDAQVVAQAKQLFESGEGHDLMEGIGFKLESGYLDTAEFKNRVKDANDIKQEIQSGSGIAALMIKFYGALMALFNLMGYISHKDPTSLAFVAAGAGIAYGVEPKHIENVFNPERRIYNEAKALLPGRNREYLTMYSKYQDFYELINLNEKEKVFTRTSKQIERQGEQAAQRADSSGEASGTPTQLGLTRDSLISGKFAAILRVGAHERLQTMTNTPFDKYSPAEVYGSVKWLFDKNIRNPDLHELARIAAQMKLAYPLTEPLAKNFVPTGIE